MISKNPTFDNFPANGTYSEKKTLLKIKEVTIKAL